MSQVGNFTCKALDSGNQCSDTKNSQTLRVVQESKVRVTPFICTQPTGEDE